MHIKKGVFIGARSIIMPGVFIGENAIVAAGSVVTKLAEPNTVVGGNAAQLTIATAVLLLKNQERMKIFPLYEWSYTIGRGIAKEKKEQMKKELRFTDGYVV